MDSIVVSMMQGISDLISNARTKAVEINKDGYKQNKDQFDILTAIDLKLSEVEELIELFFKIGD